MIERITLNGKEQKRAMNVALINDEWDVVSAGRLANDVAEVKHRAEDTDAVDANVFIWPAN